MACSHAAYFLVRVSHIKDYQLVIRQGRQFFVNDPGFQCSQLERSQRKIEYGYCLASCWSGVLTWFVVAYKVVVLYHDL